MRYAATLLFALCAWGQTFEVTSVKPYVKRGGNFMGIQPACKDGRFQAVTPLIITLVWAYDLHTSKQIRDFQLQLPLWAQSLSGAYELEATTRPDVTEAECRKMAQNLFEERFKFKYHWVTVMGDVYEMVIAPGGLKMEPADPNDPASNYNLTVNGRKPELTLPPDFPVWQGSTMEDLANRFSGNPDKIRVIDKTGIQGKFKLKLVYSAGKGLNSTFADPDELTAAEQQLGLKFIKAKGPVQSFILDHIEKPDAN